MQPADDPGLRTDVDAAAQLYRWTGGWPFYVARIARETRDLAEQSEGTINPGVIDLAFQNEVLTPTSPTAEHCQYLWEHALGVDSAAFRTVLESVVREIAEHQPLQH